MFAKCGQFEVDVEVRAIETEGASAADVAREVALFLAVSQEYERLTGKRIDI